MNGIFSRRLPALRSLHCIMRGTLLLSDRAVLLCRCRRPRYVSKDVAKSDDPWLALWWKIPDSMQWGIGERTESRNWLTLLCLNIPVSPNRNIHVIIRSPIAARTSSIPSHTAVIVNHFSTSSCFNPASFALLSASSHKNLHSSPLTLLTLNLDCLSSCIISRGPPGFPSSRSSFRPIGTANFFLNSTWTRSQMGFSLVDLGS